jgi:HNH endonuclease
MAVIECTCALCGRPFSTKFRRQRALQRYCSFSCAMRHRHQAKSAWLMATFWQRFWERVVKRDDGCWLWTGPVVRQGYGVITRPGFPRAKRLFRAHRLSWEDHYGPIPAAVDILHRCDVPACVRPEHLFLGTDLDNQRDAKFKGRKARGSRCARAKLTEADVRAIRAASDADSQELAARYGTTRGNIRRILTRRTWNHL